MFDRRKLAYELSLLAEHLMMSCEPATEETEAVIIAHATEEVFSQAAIRVVGHLAVDNATDPEQANYFDGLLRLMMTSHVPWDEMSEGQKLATKLATIEAESFLYRLKAQQSK